jgi:DNA-binding transcriptional regulator GbsR (MarR family)
MSSISEEKIRKIKDNIIGILFDSSLKPLNTEEIADELARDDEFVLRLLKQLEKENLVKQISRAKRKKLWIMSNDAYKAYKSLI